MRSRVLTMPPARKKIAVNASRAAMMYSVMGSIQTPMSPIKLARTPKAPAKTA